MSERRYARLARWGVPAGLLAGILLAPTAGSVLSAHTSPVLPDRSAAQLLVDLQTARVDGMSGTVVQRSDLGLPKLPGLDSGGGDSASLTSLITGSHTMRVWFAAPDRARVALLGTLGETDIVVNQRDVWVWSSEQRTARHRRLVASAGTPRPDGRGAAPPELPLTPQTAAERVLTAITPTTEVTTTGTALVAGRPAYELVLAPRDPRSLVHEARIAIDAKAHVPLRLEVFAAGHDAPVFQVGFTQVSFTRPDADTFQFAPPPGTTVTEVVPSAVSPRSAPDAQRSGPSAGTVEPVVVGTGWTAVIVAKVPPMPAQPATSQARRHGPGRSTMDSNRLLASLPRVSGTWGNGRLLRSSLFSVLITDDGRVVAGAVAPDLLYTAARTQTAPRSK